MRPLIFAFVDYVRSCRRIGRKRNQFHETNVTLAVDLTAGFNLTGIAVSRDAAEEASAAISLQYPVAAYFCDEGSVEIPPPVFSQGSVLQFCVEMNENVTTTGVYVSDVLMVDLDQSSGD
jgi:hypothetical protein